MDAIDPQTNDEVSTIDLTPHWSQTTRWFARLIIEHGFEKSAYGVMASFMEQVGYLAQKNPSELRKIIDGLNALDARSHPSLVLGSVPCFHCGGREQHEKDCQWNINSVG